MPSSQSRTAWLAAWRNVLPRAVRETVRNAPVGSVASLVDLLESDREGDDAQVAQIVSTFGRQGCVSPAVHLLRFRREEGRSVNAAGIAALLDAVGLAERGEFGGITHIATELLADGADSEAIAWSSSVDEARLFLWSAEPDREALEAYYQDRYERNHGLWCVQLCNESDARLLGALALVDWTGGARDQAKARALACDQGSDTNGWSAAGVELLAGWVLSQDLASTERIARLRAAINESQRSHVDLGPLGVQLHAELAGLLAEVGDDEGATHHHAQADRFRSKPTMRLHFQSFQFPALLGRLPLIN
jgi:hypothetical protein